MGQTKLIGLIMFIVGLITLLGYKKILKIQGSDKKGYWPMDIRKRQLISTGIGLIILGIYILLDSILKK